MTEVEFAAARRLADRTTRPDTAFAVLVALCCLVPPISPSKLAALIDVDLADISKVGRQLETMGVIAREWDVSSKPATNYTVRRRGRTRSFRLRPAWTTFSV